MRAVTGSPAAKSAGTIFDRARCFSLTRRRRTLSSAATCSRKARWGRTSWFWVPSVPSPKRPRRLFENRDRSFSGPPPRKTEGTSPGGACACDAWSKGQRLTKRDLRPGRSTRGGGRTGRSAATSATHSIRHFPASSLTQHSPQARSEPWIAHPRRARVETFRLVPDTIAGASIGPR